MSTGVQPTSGSSVTGSVSWSNEPSALRTAATWAAWGALSFPLAVLLHELGHYLLYIAYDFRDPVLHYGSAGYANSEAFWRHLRAGDVAAAAAIVPPWQAGVATAAGLVSTYLTVAACVLLARRRPHPLIVGLGFVAPLRFLPSVIELVLALLGRNPRTGSDEEHVAAAWGIPEMPLHLLGVACLVAGWYLLFRAVPRSRRRRVLPLIAGIIVGGVLYINLVGPWLLP